MQVGMAVVDAFVLEKPEPRHSKDGKQTYYNLVLGDVGWRQRIPCTLAVYNNVVTTVPDRAVRYSFKGKLEATRATRVGSNFADDMQQLTLEAVKETAAPAATAPAAAAAK